MMMIMMMMIKGLSVISGTFVLGGVILVLCRDAGGISNITNRLGWKVMSTDYFKNRFILWMIFLYNLIHTEHEWFESQENYIN